MAEDDDQRQVQRVSGIIRPEVEIPRPKPEKRWTLVNRRLIFHNQFNNRFPQFEWVDHRVQEPELDQVPEQMKRTQMIVKRNVSDSQREPRPEKARRGRGRTGSEGGRTTS